MDLKREERRKKAENVVNAVKKFSNNSIKKYHWINNFSENQNDLEEKEQENFETLIDLYEKINKDWIKEYNEFEEQRKPINKRFGTDKIKRNTQLMDIIGNVGKDENDKASRTAMSMYLANKIAHCCGVARDRLVEYKLFERHGEDSFYLDIVKDISKDVKLYFYAKQKKDITKMKRLEKRLNTLGGLSNDDLQSLEDMGVPELVKLELEAFNIKTNEMMALVQKLQKRDENQKNGKNSDELDKPMSYGLGKAEDKKDILIIDLPYFGQFSVHMREPATISVLTNNPYGKLVYSIESVMLTKEMSPKAKEDSKKANRTTEGIKKISGDIKYKHYLVLKNGGSKEELDEIYQKPTGKVRRIPINKSSDEGIDR